MSSTSLRVAFSCFSPAPFVFFSRRVSGLLAGYPLRRLGGTLVLLFAPLALSAASPKWEPVSAAELAEEKPLIEPSAGVEILNYQLDIDDHNNSGRVILERFRFKIFDPSRATEATRIAALVTAGDGSQNVEVEIAARLTLPDGTVREFGKSDLRTRSIVKEGPGNGALSFLSKSEREAQEKFLAISGVVKGAVLDVWQRQPKLAKTPWHVMPIQRREIPIRRFEYTSRFEYDPELIHRFYVLNPNGGKMSHDEKGGVINFHAENLGSLPNETLMAPATYFSLTIIQASEKLKTYVKQQHTYRVPLPNDVPASLGPWAYFSTTEDFYDADWGFTTKRVKQKAAELTLGATTEREKARRIYTFVQALYQRFRPRADLENWYTRYIESTDELIELDKIDSTIIITYNFYCLFVALTRAAGLECHSAFHPMRTSFPFVPDLVARNFLIFRTVAVKVDGNWEICEPCSTLPLAFGQRPWVIENQRALLALPQQQTFLFVPPAPAESSVAETQAEVELDTSGNIQGECVRTFTGHEAEVMRERLNATGCERWWTLVRSMFDLESSSADARLISVEGQDAFEQPLRIKAFIRWPAYAALMEGRIMLAPSIFSDGQGPLLSATTRKTPVFFDYPVAKKDTISIQLPRGYRPGPLPPPIATSSGEYSYALSMQFDAVTGILSVKRAWINRAVEIPVEKYPDAHSWFSRVCAADQIGIILRTGEPKK